VKAEPTLGLDLSIFEAVIASGTAAERGKLAEELASLTASAETPEHERKAVVPCILKLAGDPVLDVRQSLAEGLARAPESHPDIVFMIIADDDEIALPFLAVTEALDSWMMLAVVRVGDVARQMQVALRSDVSPAAVGYIVARSSLPVCVALFDNQSAELEERHLRMLYTRFGHSPAIVERLLACEDLPLDIRVLQARRASNRIHQLMAERGWVPANDAAEIVADAEETAVLNILTGATSEELQKVIGFLTSKNMLTPSIIMRAACLGEMTVVERALAHLCDVPLDRAHQLIHTKGPLRSLYKKAGLPQNYFGLLRAAFDVEREFRDEGRPVGAGNFGRRLIEALMTQYETTMPERAKHLEIVARFGEEQVRVIARRLKTDLVRAA
jgi:uncharacterized protein (DUF2336 family)